MGKYKTVSLTAPQMAVVLSKQKKKTLEWGRGSGKSTVLGYIMKALATQMPRASFSLVGATYMQMLSRTLPSTREGLEMFNLYEGYDYVIGKSGQKFGFAMPFQAPSRRWDNIIHFSNGAIFQMVSLDNPNLGRGLNTYASVGDEAKDFDPEKLYTNVTATNRARKAIFDKAPLLNAEIYAGSTPLDKSGQWFTDREKLAIEHPEEYVHIKANAYSNAHNLDPNYFKNMRNNAPSLLYYKAEILNIRPSEIVDGFYPQLKPDIHYYTDYNNGYLETQADKTAPSFDCRQDNDIDTNKPIEITIDFGASINSLVVTQPHSNEHRVLKSFYVKSPKILNDLLIEEFLPYYFPHQNKTVNFYYDHTGNSRQVNHNLTHAQQVEKLLREHGWTVYRMTRGAAPTHMEKYLLINVMLKEINPRLPVIRINRYNNEDLIISLERAEAKEGTRGGFMKDKSSERNKSVQQQHATHLSDTFDIPIYAKYHQRLNKDYEYNIMPISMR